MVEFGLKLEDNKVAEWREQYMDYERLKQILKKCAAAVARWDDLAAKQPERAALIRRNFVNGQDTPVATPHTSASDLEQIGSAASAESQPAQPGRERVASLPSLAMEATTASEGTQLSSSGGAAASKTYGTNIPLGESSERSTNSASELTRLLQHATSGVSDYFYKSYERQVRKELTEIRKHAADFETCLQTDLVRVNSFYNETLQEFEERLRLLKESVAAIAASRNQQQQAQQQQQQQAQDAMVPDSPRDAEAAAGMTSAAAADTATAAAAAAEDYLETPLLEKRKSKWTQMDGLALAIAKRLGREGSSVVELHHRHRRRPTTVSEETQQPEEPSHDHTTSVNLGNVHDDEDDDDGSSSRRQSRRQEEEDAVRRSKEAQSIQRALVDMYRRAKLLHNFAIMNYTGFVKIVKKHDKTLKENKGKFKAAIQPEQICNEGKAVEQLTETMERLYANWFCDRNLNEARAQLLPKRDDGLQMDWSQLRLGYRMGMCTILAIWVTWDCIWGLVQSGKTTIGARTAFPVFRACGGLLLLEWCWGCSVWIWTRYRVNYIFIMDLDPSIVQSPLAIFNAAVDDTLVFLVGMLLYYKAGAHDIPKLFPAGIFPGCIVMYTVSRLLFPLRIRVPMWKAIWKVVSAPMYSPSFFHNYIGDIFTSLVKVFQDLAWALFFIISGDVLESEDAVVSQHEHSTTTRHYHPWSKTVWYSKILIPLLTLLPLWFRFNQCLRRYMDTRKRLPHLANAFKYALSQTVTLFGAFHPLYMAKGEGSSIFQMFWTFTFVASSLYSFAWDVVMDWGLGLPKYGFLGPRLMYPDRRMYYAIIAIDLVLRFAWVLTLVPPDSGADFALPAYLTMVSMMLELFRRTIWGFLRLENEHRNNTAGYRRVGFVPLHFTTGHSHDYKHHEKEHRGVSVLLEVAVVTLIVLGVSVASVVAAQQATERTTSGAGGSSTSSGSGEL